jgi:transcriptional regulator with XRE-family HTH domain
MYERATPILRANADFDIFLSDRNSLTPCLIRIIAVILIFIALQSTPNKWLFGHFSHFLLTIREHLVNFPLMKAQKATAAPGRFIRTLKDAMHGQGLTLRQLADKAGVSPAYLSRLFNQERGLPGNETIAKFEEVLDIQPRGALFDAAGRHDGVAAKFVQITGARLLMRTLAPLTEAEMAKVQKVAQRFANQHTKETK